MDLYQKNSSSIRRLLAKRQSVTAQIFKLQSSDTQNLTNSPKPNLNSLNNTPTCTLDFDYINQQLQANQSSPTTRKTSFDQSENLQAQKFKKATVTSPITIIDLESDEHEPFEKKIKSSAFSSANASRRTSFDEEKEVSEHSTTCETHSEMGHLADFLWSPPISAQAHPTKDPVILILDEEEVPSKSEAPFMFAETNKDALIYAEAQSQAEMLGGNCLTGSLSNGKFKFTCKLRHQWEASMEEMSQRWCPKCDNMLKKCRAYAYAKGGSCLSEKFDETISFKCHAGHIWNTSSRLYNSKWCAECIQEEKDSFKKKCEEARAKREKMEEECQQKLFEEARRKAMNGIANQGPCSKEDVLKYFQKVDAEVEVLAKKEADKFMSQGANGNVSYEQALQVYKILLVPEDILKKYMMSLSADILKSEFRRMAKIIHPDKNKHPNSGSAFQKVYKVYENFINV